MAKLFLLTETYSVIFLTELTNKTIDKPLSSYKILVARRILSCSFRGNVFLMEHFNVIICLQLQIAITGSIFMTVAIALERFIAVHYPIDYSQAMHEANALSKRILKYVSAVIILSVVFTITRY